MKVQKILLSSLLLASPCLAKESPQKEVICSPAPADLYADGSIEFSVPMETQGKGHNLRQTGVARFAADATGKRIEARITVNPEEEVIEMHVVRNGVEMYVVGDEQVDLGLAGTGLKDRMNLLCRIRSQ